MINNFHLPGQTVLTHLTLPYKLYFLVFYIIYPMVNCEEPRYYFSFSSHNQDMLVKFCLVPHRTKPLLWLYYGQYSSFYIIGIVFRFLGFFNIKYKMHYQLSSAPASCPFVCLFFSWHNNLCYVYRSENVEFVFVLTGLK